MRREAELPEAERDALRAIHEAAFAAEERQYSMDYMIEQAERPDAALRVVRDAGRVAGYLYLEFSADPTTAFLWYFAVDERVRSRGIGHVALLDTLATLRRGHPMLRYVLFEVHRPSDDDPARAQLDRRRIEFYRRLGAFWVRGVDYRIPAADDPTRDLVYDPMFFVLEGDFDPDEIRQRIMLMAADNYRDHADDPRWKGLQRSQAMSIVEPPAAALRRL